MRVNILIAIAVLFSSFAFAAKKAPPASIVCNQALTDTDDLFLEDVHGKKAMKWVDKQNARSVPQLENDPRYSQIFSSLLEAYDSPDRKPGFSIRKGEVLNFWTDDKNKKGLLRRIRYAEFMKGSRAWEVILDIDALAMSENENWVYKGGSQFKNRKLMGLSRDGKDASVVREFDMQTKQFIPDGFNLPEGKHSIGWVDKNTVLVGLARPGHAEDVTDSGYPRTIRLWKRGTKVEEAPVIYEISKTDMSIAGYVLRDITDGPVTRMVVERKKDFYTGETFFYENGKLTKLDVPDDSEHHIENGLLYLKTTTSIAMGGVTYGTGALLRFRLSDYLAGSRHAEVLFESRKQSILEGYSLINSRIFLTLKQDVISRVYELTGTVGSFKLKPLSKNADPFVMQNIYASDEDENILVLQETGYLTPTTRSLVHLKDNSIELIDRSREWFDASPYVVEQNFAKSKDGTLVPYFLVRRKDMKFDGTQPILQYGYGGFRLSEEPYYSVGYGRGWLEQGGALVVANIRGGAEYGTEWHEAALKKNRQRAYDDFHAVAEDLIARKITSSKHLGVMGGSNGGLLTGVAYTQRPDLYSAAVVSVPLLDMLRYHTLHAGASWMGEYGNPEEPDMAEYIRTYSPYHNLKPGVQYIEPFINTSTADDRVHPSHARRTAARMERLGQPVLFFENVEGGHAGSTDSQQAARLSAYEFVYLLQKLKN